MRSKLNTDTIKQCYSTTGTRPASMSWSLQISFWTYHLSVDHSNTTQIPDILDQIWDDMIVQKRI